MLIDTTGLSKAKLLKLLDTIKTSDAPRDMIQRNVEHIESMLNKNKVQIFEYEQDELKDIIGD